MIFLKEIKKIKIFANKYSQTGQKKYIMKMFELIEHPNLTFEGE